MPDTQTKILAVDTATQTCSVALRDNEGHIHVRTEIGKGIHSELLFVFIDDLLNEVDMRISDLDAVISSMGPGSYTGLRIAASAVKGLLFGRHISFYGVNTLAYFAQCALNTIPDITRIHAIIDARRVHVYHQVFSFENKFKAETDVEIREINRLRHLIRPGDGIVGTGINRLREDMLEPLQVIDNKNITASCMIDLFDLMLHNKLENTEERIIKKVAPNEFVPYYYGSVQVRHNSR